jgi:hypothetical protein
MPIKPTVRDTYSANADATYYAAYYATSDADATYVTTNAIYVAAYVATNAIHYE